MASMGEPWGSRRRPRAGHPRRMTLTTRRARKPDPPATRCKGEGKHRTAADAASRRDRDRRALPGKGGSSMTRQLIAAVTLSLSLAGMQSGALAQQTQAPVITGNVKGSCVMAPPAGNPGANAGDWTITCGDLDPGAGMTVIGSPSVESIPVPVDVAPAPVPASEPATEPAAVDDPATDVTADAVAAESDTDGDGISDDYEINVYATDPGLWDTD